jgi:hypothetical protein
MAIAVQMDFAGGTLAQYDNVIAKMGFRHHGTGAPGALFHWVTKSSHGVRVVDVWETRELFEKFGKEKIGPITAQEGLSAPETTFFEVHNYLTKG